MKSEQIRSDRAMWDKYRKSVNWYATRVHRRAPSVATVEELEGEGWLGVAIAMSRIDSTMQPNQQARFIRQCMKWRINMYFRDRMNPKRRAPESEYRDDPSDVDTGDRTNQALVDYMVREFAFDGSDSDRTAPEGRAEEVERVLGTARQEIRDAIRYHYYDELTFQAAEDRYGIHRGTLFSRVQQGIRYVRATLGIGAKLRLPSAHDARARA